MTRLTQLWRTVATHQAPGQAGAAEARSAGWSPERSWSRELPSCTLPRLLALGTGALGHLGRFWPLRIPWLPPRRLTKGRALLPATGTGESEIPPCSQACGEEERAALPLDPVTALSPFPRQHSSLALRKGLAGKTAPPPSTEKTAGWSPEEIPGSPKLLLERL